MKTTKKFWFLPLLLLGLAACGEENTTPVQPEIPPVEEQVVICELTAPTAGTELDLTEADGFEIEGNALVNTGEIADVELKVGNTIIEEVNAVPFTFRYTFAAEQEPEELVVTLTVTGDRKASDSSSVTITLIRSEEPEPTPEQEITLSLTAPAEGFEWVSEAPLTISGEGSVNTGKIESLTLTVGNEAVSEVTELPFTYAYTAPEELAEGEVIILLTAVGDQGAEASKQVTITHKKPQVTPPPTPPTPATDEMVDPRDNKVYKIVTLGEQTWMAENLAYLPEVYPSSEAVTDGVIRYYVYNYEGSDVNEAKATEEYALYGALYNWYAANATTSEAGASAEAVPSGVQGICPEGWHLPSKAEWQILEAWVGDQLDPVTGMNSAYETDSNMKNVWSALAAREAGWGESYMIEENPDLAYGPRDLFGFRAVPAGKCWHNGGFGISDADTGFWATDMQAYGGGCVELRNSQYYLGYTKSGYSARRGYSVRCVKD